MKLLHLDSSIQADGSASRAVSAAIVAALIRSDSTLDVIRHDLAADPLPHLTLDRFGSEEGKMVLDTFLSANIVVIGAPMYNFGIPTQLKAWFDHVLVAGQTFRYGPDGVEGLVGDKRVIVAASRGGIYAADSASAANEHAENHLRSIFGFIGVSDLEIIVAEGIAYGPEQREAALAGAFARVAGLPPSVLASAA